MDKEELDELDEENGAGQKHPDENWFYKIYYDKVNWIKFNYINPKFLQTMLPDLYPPLLGD